ncbi:MAG: L-2-amino-thiazoline-4-carboxylic acid hydrolase [Anaerolineales bacterium]|nr:L-2-amino-thiazoline-4-carboxylic acid hydrolase [Anaerolineales bacterium]
MAAALTGSAYYLAQREKLIGNHRKMLAVGRDLLAERYGAAEAPAILSESDTEFAALIPHIPYIGGAANSYTDLQVQMTSLLALYRSLTRRGRPVAEIGALVHLIGERTVNQTPAMLRRLIGRFYMSRFWRGRAAKRAALSQQRHYPGDFVTEVVPGQPGDGFEWGINYHACGVVKFFAAQGADEFTPYMCVMDYLLFPAMGVGLQRTGTIAHGCTHCDFRFKHGGASEPAWPPKFLKESEAAPE